VGEGVSGHTLGACCSTAGCVGVEVRAAAASRICAFVDWLATRRILVEVCLVPSFFSGPAASDLSSWLREDFGGGMTGVCAKYEEMECLWKARIAAVLLSQVVCEFVT
jgi:hypothetical protein